MPQSLVRCQIVLLFLLVSLPAGAGTPPAAQARPPAAQAPPATPTSPSATTRLRVYLDCFDCFPTFLRDEINWVDFVREPQDADVHLLSRSSGTGGGGREVLLRFVGRGQFANDDRELRAITLTGDTEDARRRAVLQTVMVGLLGYVAHAGLPDTVSVSVRSAAQAAGAVAEQDDPWNLWVFSLRGGGSYDAEETQRERNWQLNASADRVTDQWKVSFGGRVNQNVRRFDLDEDDPFEVTRRDRRFNWFVARSLGPHWSMGLDGEVSASTFGNTKFSVRSAPAVEYSIFPYADYASKQLVVQYEVGVVRAEYDEITLFDKLEETLPRHEVSIRLDQRQPWGTLRAGAEFSQYLHDRGKYRVEVSGEIDFRIARGFSVSFEMNASRIRDQISLPRRGATPEEVLLRVRQLASGYEVGVSFGVTYSFGSIFNNVVNPRFGGGGGGFNRGGGR